MPNKIAKVDLQLNNDGSEQPTNNKADVACNTMVIYRIYNFYFFLKTEAGGGSCQKDIKCLDSIGASF